MVKELTIYQGIHDDTEYEGSYNLLGYGGGAQKVAELPIYEGIRGI